MRPPELTLLQRLTLRLTGKAFLGLYTRKGWPGIVRLYAVWCPEHGLFMDYPHSWDGRFDCPRCLEAQVLDRACKAYQGARQ